MAVLAKKHNVPFYIAAPISTFDLSIPTHRIPCEERSYARPSEDGAMSRRRYVNRVLRDRAALTFATHS